MATWDSPIVNPLYPHALQNVTIDVGAATRDYVFKPLRRYQIVQLDSSADAADSTDKYTASLVNATTSDTIITGSVCAATDTIVSVTSVDSNKSDILLPGHTYKLTITFAGTAANVKGVQINLWAKAASHE